VNIVDGYKGKGYGKTSEEELKEFATHSGKYFLYLKNWSVERIFAGIIFDPVYTMKVKNLRISFAIVICS